MKDLNQHKLLIVLALAGPLLFWISGQPLAFILIVIIAVELPVIFLLFAQEGKYRTLVLNAIRLYLIACVVFLSIGIKKIITSPADILNNEISTVLPAIALLFYIIIYYVSKKIYTKIELSKIQQN